MPFLRHVWLFWGSCAFFAACGAPNAPNSQGFPENWTAKTFWKENVQKIQPKMVNFIFDSEQDLARASEDGSFLYKEVRPINLIAAKEEAGLGSAVSWSLANHLQTTDGGTIKTFKLMAGAVPVDSAEIKQMIDGSGGKWTNGRVPQLLLNDSQDLNVPEFALSAEETKERAPKYLIGEGVKWGTGKATLIAGASELHPAWSFIISAEEGYSYPIFPTEVVLSAVSGEILRTKELNLHATGTAEHMYMENQVVDGSQLRSIALPYLSAEGANVPLVSDKWKVVSCNQQEPSASCISRTLSSANTVFSPSPADDTYDELVAYHSLARAFDWNVGKMGEAGLAAADRKSSGWGLTRDTLGLSNSNQMTVYVRSLAKTATGSPTLSNAQYYPGGLSGSQPPAIVIGTGWEPSQGAYPLGALRYLGKDSDVVMHEFHHHVIWRSMTDVSGETGALHEGIADYLTYAITGNNKLGEAIVPSDSAKGGLRAGNLTGSISTYYNRSVHQAGEFWSSTLWDVRTQMGTASSGAYHADKIIWDAVDLAISSETYYGFIAAMAKSTDAYAAARGENAVTLKNTMFAVFAARGFINAPDGTGNLPSATQYISVAKPAAPVAKTSSKSKGICGAIGNNNSQTTWWISAFFILIAITPLLHGIKNRRRQQRVRTSVRAGAELEQRRSLSRVQ